MQLQRPTGFRGIFRDDEPARAVYSEAAGIARCVPAAVAVPADTDDVRVLASWARPQGVALVPRGSGSSMAGGAVGPGVVVDLSRMKSCGEIDKSTRRVSVGPGVLRAVLAAHARAAGLRFPVDPSSGAYCTVGGMAATNAAGAHTLRFGPMREWVSALECVFEDGSCAEIRRGDAAPEGVPALERFAEIRSTLSSASAHDGVLKDSSGYALRRWMRTGDLVDLLVGSEGTLAIFTRLELRLAPVPPATSSVLAAFTTLEGAVESALRAREIGASACELLDRTFLEVAASGGSRLPVPGDAEAVLLIEIEAPTRNDAANVARILKRSCVSAGASQVTLALNPATERMVWSLRHAASPMLSRLDPRLRSMQFIEDGAVPPGRLAEYVRGVRAALSAHRVRGVIFGHAGDAHIHVNPLVDVTSPDWRDRVRGVLDAVAELTSRLGGTLAGEHGDGRLRAPFLDRMWPEQDVRSFRAVKQAFDPHGILNPGVKLALPGQDPLESVKYDPELPALPAVARAALDLVERERAYDRFRLALLDEAA